MVGVDVLKSGYIIEFRRKGFTGIVLGGLLKLFEPSWDGWGWHLAIAWEKGYQEGWLLLEATAGGVMCNFYEDCFLERNTRSWKWLDEIPTRAKKDKFFETHILRHYDIASSFWLVVQYLIRHYFNHRIPRLLDDRFSCWELVFEFCEEMGKPIASKYDCPILIDLLKNFEGDKDGTNK